MYKTWEELKSACLGCEKCELCRTRTNVVVGVGNPEAEVMFIGEGPGENEDLQGEPFVGRGGKLLDKMLTAVDLDRKKNIYIANIRSSALSGCAIRCALSDRRLSYASAESPQAG